MDTNAYSINEYNVVEGIRISTDLDHPKLMDCTTFIHPTIMAKTEWFRANPYDVKAVRVEDYELWSRTLEKNTFKQYSEPLLYYREFGYDYYKKYFKGIKSLFYVANKKGKISSYSIAIKYCCKAIIYFCFNILGIENVLIKKRYTKIDEQKRSKAQEYINNIIPKRD